MTRILIAPNAFKSGASAAQAAAAIARGLAASALDCETICHPVADGGDGTGELLAAALGAERASCDSCDALGRPVAAGFAWLPDAKQAIIEFADGAGLRQLDPAELDPLRASSFGVGLLIAGALDRGATEIILCLGGSATVDGGAGLLEALGVGFKDASGDALSSRPAGLANLASLDLTIVHPRLRDCRFTILCDVLNPLCGMDGAARAFGPQKGADEAAILFLEVMLARLAEQVETLTGKDIRSTPRGGAAGGVAAILNGLLNAQLVGGIDYFLDRTGFDQAVMRADLVITGEGAIDVQTLSGKAPYGVAMRAKAFGVPVCAIAGSVPPVPDPRLAACFEVMTAIAPGPLPLAEAKACTERDLERTAALVGDLLALKLPSAGA